MKKYFITAIIVIVIATTSVLAYVLPYFRSEYPFSEIQIALLALLVIITAGIIAAAAFEYIFTTELRRFLYELNQSWNKYGSFESMKRLRLESELQEVLETVSVITKGEIDRIKELESKGGYSDVYYNLVSTISHQLRTPVTGLRWALTTLKDEAEKGQALDMAMLSDSVSAVSRIGDIIEELLVGINENKGRKKVFEPVDIERALEDALSESSLLAKERSLRLEVVKKDKLIPLVRGVPYEVRFIFHSLITNALTYSKEKETVTITLGQENGFVTIEVRDFGIPISEKEKLMIFSQFNRGREAISVNPNGSGLGLYLTREIVQNHQGAISFESDEKNGTVFTVKLPLSHKGDLENSIHF